MFEIQLFDGIFKVVVCQLPLSERKNRKYQS